MGAPICFSFFLDIRDFFIDLGEQTLRDNRRKL